MSVNSPLSAGRAGPSVPTAQNVFVSGTYDAHQNSSRPRVEGLMDTELTVRLR